MCDHAFGAELDWEKLWRDQVFGAKMTETNGKKLLFFRGSVWHPKCDHGSLFWTELDWEKLWRDQVWRMTETNGNKLVFF